MTTATTLDDRLAQIATVFDEPIEIAAAHHGDDFDVIEVNAAWMFRFPRRDVARAALAQERAFLPQFVPLSPLPVPDYAIDAGEFVGYRKLAGEELTGRVFAALDANTRTVLAREIANFLTALHAFPLEEARALGLSHEWGHWYHSAYATYREHIAPQLSPAARAAAQDALDAFFAVRYVPAVIHGDFSSDHILFDARRAALAVIDFGDLTIGDPVRDLYGLAEDYGEDFLQAVVAGYGGALDPGWRVRARLYARVRPVFEAAYCHEFGWDDLVPRKVRAAEQHFGKEGQPHD
jgi:aminoglycoside 2''-phosphotransferase